MKGLRKEEDKSLFLMPKVGDDSVLTSELSLFLETLAQGSPDLTALGRRPHHRIAFLALIRLREGRHV